MNYIWDVALKAQKQGVSFEDIIFYPARPVTPYTEVAFSDINQRELADPIVEVNAMYRFNIIFKSLLDTEYEDDAELKEALFDVLMHYLALLDLRQGFCRWEYYQQFFKRDFYDGKFGTRHKELFDSDDRQHSKYFSAYLVAQYQAGSSLIYLRAVIKALYPRSIVYLNTDKKLELLIYIGKKETLKLRRQVEYLCDAFIPFEYTVHLFWDKHFGIIGIDETMVPDEIIVF
ncbi:hypothetical protein DS742_07405 [Lacrimispora amygdalina]|uniref:Iron-dependent peroxidase n=1 Tax=Lacrimispora amygdalina TaxID=253257 RepID=A0A3E2NF03_9FIRM|nr:hypothetical protein [Clostridium indicum]RFZ79592.1 hypothetical protein DS742_07405 [Clostridium indicum]